MLILALDSTAIAASAAIVKDGRLLAEFTVNTGLTHSETLLPMVEAVLKMTKKSIDDIDVFACNSGPGSFTGVRIGTATIKGLAYGRNKPCVGVSTLDSLSRNASCLDGIICPVMNARRQQVYNALFECKNGKLRRLCPDRAIAIAELGEELSAMLQAEARPVYLVGDGAVMTHEAFEIAQIPSVLLPDRLIHQSAVNTALCAEEAVRNGDVVSDATLVPVYLRQSQAERTRAEAEEKRVNK